MTTDEKIKVMEYWGCVVKIKKLPSGKTAMCWSRRNADLDIKDAPQYDNIDLAIHTAYGWVYWHAVKDLQSRGLLANDE